MDSQTTALPTEQDLRKLHVRGIIAYATRCVRRAQRHYTSGRFSYDQVIDNMLHAGEEFAAGRNSRLYWQDVRRATIYAETANGESVSIAVERLVSALVNAQTGCIQPSVYEYAVLAVDAALDACYGEEFIDSAWADFRAIEKMSKDRYPTLGPVVDMSVNGPLGPVWPIWESIPVLKRQSKRHPK